MASVCILKNSHLKSDKTNTVIYIDDRFQYPLAPFLFKYPDKIDKLNNKKNMKKLIQ